MSVRINCPICGKRLNIPDELVGKRVKCFCKAVFTAKAAAPKPSPVPIEAAADETAVEDSPKRRFKLPFDLSLDVETLRDSVMTAVRSILAPVIIACAAIILLLTLGGGYVLELDDLVAGSPRGGMFPLIVATFFGAGFGFSLGHCLSDKGGAVGTLGCAVGMTAVILVLLVAYFGGMIRLGYPIPDVWKLAIMCIGFMGTLGVSYFTLWSS